ncbi:MAG: hypothetical protein ACOYVK_01655 [Bacillota bacterium]
MDDLKLNEILVRPVVTAGTALALRTDLYDIESTNTTEARIQSVSTDTGSEHTVQKLSNESLIATKVPYGTVELIAASEAVRDVLAFVTLKSGPIL